MTENDRIMTCAKTCTSGILFEMDHTMRNFFALTLWNSLVNDRVSYTSFCVPVMSESVSKIWCPDKCINWTMVWD